jgi:hypothetical protein
MTARLARGPNLIVIYIVILKFVILKCAAFGCAAVDFDEDERGSSADDDGGGDRGYRIRLFLLKLRLQQFCPPAIKKECLVRRDVRIGAVANNSSLPRRTPQRKTTRKKFFFPCILPTSNA